MTSALELRSESSSESAPTEGAAARWSHKRGWFYWAVIAILDPIVAVIALILWIVSPRER